MRAGGRGPARTTTTEPPGAPAAPRSGVGRSTTMFRCIALRAGGGARAERARCLQPSALRVPRPLTVPLNRPPVRRRPPRSSTPSSHVRQPLPSLALPPRRAAAPRHARPSTTFFPDPVRKRSCSAPCACRASSRPSRYATARPSSSKPPSSSSSPCSCRTRKRHLGRGPSRPLSMRPSAAGFPRISRWPWRSPTPTAGR